MIVIKPEDLPEIMGAIGRFIRKIKKLSAEFMAMFEEAAGDTKDGVKVIASDVGEVNRELKQITDMDGNLRDTHDTSDLADLDSSRK